MDKIDFRSQPDAQRIPSKVPNKPWNSGIMNTIGKLRSSIGMIAALGTISGTAACGPVGNEDKYGDSAQIQGDSVTGDFTSDSADNPGGDGTDGDATIDTNIDPQKGLVICDEQHALTEQFLGLSETLEQCKGCHTVNGAWRWNTSSPAALEDSMKGFSKFARMKADNGQPFIVELPQGQTTVDGVLKKHQGGHRDLSDLDKQLLTSYSDSLATYDAANGGENAQLPVINTNCNDGQLHITQEEFFQTVEMLSNQEVLSKFLRMFAPNLPESIPNVDSNEMLAANIRQATHTPAFYKWLENEFNDITHARSLSDKNTAIDSLTKMIPSLKANLVGAENADVANSLNDLLLYIAFNELPLTELLKAQYIVLPGEKMNKDDPNFNIAAHLIKVPVNEPPIAGMFTHPAWLRINNSTESNQDRGRTLRALRFAIDFDILSLGSQMTPSDNKKYKDPVTINNPDCAGCHNGQGHMDQIAPIWSRFPDVDGKFDSSDNFKFPPDQLVVSYNGHKININAKDSARQLMTLLVLDPEMDESAPDFNPDRQYPFARSMAKMTYRMITHNEPLIRPAAGEANYDDKLLRYNAESGFFRDMAKFLKANKYNFRELVVKMVMSPHFRANGKLNATITPNREIQLENVGPNLITPEELDVRLHQLFGDDIFKLGIHQMVMKDHFVDLGGSDPLVANKRNSTGDSSRELALNAVAFKCGAAVVSDLAKPNAQRKIFSALKGPIQDLKPKVNFEDVDTIPEVEFQMRQVFVRIRHLALGQFKLGTSDPLIDKDFEKWLEMWAQYQDDIGSKKVATLHQSGNVKDDVYGVIRTWEAFMIDLIASSKFYFSSPVEESEE